jgi:AbrB family transcriptional regulator, transcriptional pleiotropic regulator of transition state genes
MKSTGIVRKMDELGRIVIPKEIRKNLNIGEGDALEIYVDGDVVLLKKYQPGCSCCGNIEDNLIKVGQVTLCKECLIKFTNEV